MKKSPLILSIVLGIMVIGTVLSADTQTSPVYTAVVVVTDPDILFKSDSEFLSKLSKSMQTFSVVKFKTLPNKDFYFIHRGMGMPLDVSGLMSLTLTISGVSIHLNATMEEFLDEVETPEYT